MVAFRLLQGWTGCLQCRIQTPAGMNRVFTVQNSNSCRDEQGVYSAEFKLCRDEKGVYNAEFKLLQDWTGCLQCRIQTPAGMNRVFTMQNSNSAGMKRVFTMQNSNSCRIEQGVYNAEFKLLQDWTGCLQCRIQTPAGMNRVFTMQNSNSCRIEQGVYNAEFKLCRDEKGVYNEFKLLQDWTGCLQCRIQTPAGMNRVFTFQRE